MTKPKPAPYKPFVPGKFQISPLDYCLVAVPVAVVMKIVEVNPAMLFVVSCIAVIPLAGLMGRATENLSETLGAGIGGLLNATFGNAAELIIALMALRRASGTDPDDPMFHVVKASITGSIIGNILLVLGAATLAGGLFHKRQTFNRTAAGMGSTLLALAAIGLVLPGVFWELTGAAHDKSKAVNVENLSFEIAVVLILVYIVSLVFSLKTHKHLFAGDEAELPTTGEHHQPEWSRRTSLIVLVVSTLGVGVVAEFLVGSVEEAGTAMGLSHIFIGVIVVAVVGNAAEHSTAVLVAMKNKMDLAVNIAVSSSIQIALFVAPVLVLSSTMMHTTHLDLHFTTLELVSVLASVAVLALVAQDGETHWMEGVMLLAVYVVLALAFYHWPEAVH